MSQRITQFGASGIDHHENDNDPGFPIADHGIRVEVVDTNHSAWGAVMRNILRIGDGHSLLMHEHGRLSTRQTILAAFVSDQVIGHLCFRVEPVRSAIGRATVRAKLDSFSVDDAYAGGTVETLLVGTADERARLMNCRAPGVGAMC